MYEDRKKAKGESTTVKIEAFIEEGEGEEPLEPPSSPSSSSSSSNGSEHSSHKRKKNSKKSSHSHYLPLLMLDVKFVLPIYDGELNAEKLDN
jgi:hypothetical protein